MKRGRWREVRGSGEYWVIKIDIRAEYLLQGSYYELGWDRGHTKVLYFRQGLGFSATRHLLSLNFGQETDKGLEVWTRSSRDNECRFQTEEHT